MLTKTIRTIAALTSGMCFAAAAVPPISQADTPATSTAKTQTSSSPTVSEFVLTKPIDIASPRLF
jgi:hypothetical protein